VGSTIEYNANACHKNEAQPWWERPAEQGHLESQKKKSMPSCEFLNAALPI
jgi:hypothetical protein